MSDLPELKGGTLIRVPVFSMREIIVELLGPQIKGWNSESIERVSLACLAFGMKEGREGKKKREGRN